MPKQTRERMIEGALKLLAEKGLQRASFHEVTQATGTPRGSIYYHFPGGKSEMVSEALARDLREVTDASDKIAADSPVEFVEKLFAYWRSFIVELNCQIGCAAAAVVIAAEDDEQKDAARTTLAGFVEIVHKRLVDFGMDETDAKRRARAVIAALEGGLLLARAEADPNALDDACEMAKTFVQN